MYGAISKKIDPVYHTAESTNKRSFETFIKKLADSLGLNPNSANATYQFEQESVSSSNSYISEEESPDY